MIMLVVASCNDQHFLRNTPKSIDAFELLRAKGFEVSDAQLQECMSNLLARSRDSIAADRFTHQYYDGKQSWVWVNRKGVSEQAAQFLSYLREQVPQLGFSSRAFYLDTIAADLERMETLQFDTSLYNINKVMARLEYHLTKAYLRYTLGQRYGFVNPRRLFNRLDASHTDTLGRPLGYALLYDVDVELAPNDFAQRALRQVCPDSLEAYLSDIQPHDSLYYRLLRQLPQAQGDAAQQKRLMANIERRRWRERQRPADRFLIVNVPAFHLWAVTPDSAIDMRIACGAVKTKTPLLNSRITYMQVNPEWIIPTSIVKNDVSRHAGDSAYFARNNYYIEDKATGEHLNPVAVSKQMLLSGKYRVAQKSGVGNSLGRLIFRFQNKFSVYLHDTSSPGVFSRLNRAVSHGCVRVQQPFRLARLLLGDVDDWTLDKIRISIGMRPETKQGHDYVLAHAADEEPPRPIRSHGISPSMPLFITYQTLFQNPVSGVLEVYPDVYGYDTALMRALRIYTN